MGQTGGMERLFGLSLAWLTPQSSSSITSGENQNSIRIMHERLSTSTSCSKGTKEKTISLCELFFFAACRLSPVTRHRP